MVLVRGDDRTYIPAILYVHARGTEPMRAKLTLTVDEELVPKGRAYARSRGASLSRLVEDLLRQNVTRQSGTFTSRWRGRLKSAERQGPRYQELRERFLL